MFNHFKSEHFKHFNSGFIGNVSVTLTDKTNDMDSKRRDNYWMRTLKIYAPLGINIADSV